MIRTCRSLNCITPPHILRKLLESKDRDVREAALKTLLGTANLRGARESAERPVPLRLRARAGGPFTTASTKPTFPPPSWSEPKTAPPLPMTP